MQISITVPDFVVRAVSGKAAVILTGAALTGVVHCVGMLGQFSPALASLVGDPVVLADRLDIVVMIVVASLGNRFHLDLGSNLGRIAAATIDAVEATASQDLAKHGIAPPAIPVLPPSPVLAPAPAQSAGSAPLPPVTPAAPDVGIDVIAR